MSVTLTGLVRQPSHTLTFTSSSSSCRFVCWWWAGWPNQRRCWWWRTTRARWSGSSWRTQTPLTFTRTWERLLVSYNMSVVIKSCSSFRYMHLKISRISLNLKLKCSFISLPAKLSYSYADTNPSCWINLHCAPLTGVTWLRSLNINCLFSHLFSFCLAEGTPTVDSSFPLNWMQIDITESEEELISITLFYYWQ